MSLQRKHFHVSLARLVQLGTIALVTACIAPAPANLPMVPGVRVDAAVDQYQIGQPRSFVRARPRLVNSGPDTARFAVGGCALVLHAYAAHARDRLPVWTSAHVHRPCPDVRRTWGLAPGDSAVLEESYSLDVISSSGLGPGRYAFAVSIGFLEPATTSPEYPAGTLAIGR